MLPKKLLLFIGLLVSFTLSGTSINAQDGAERAVNGDVNGDGAIDVDDVNIVINIMVKKNTNPAYESLADIDGNSVVDVDDLNHIINFILKKESPSDYVKPTETELYINQLPGEEDAPMVNYSHKDSLKYEAWARELIEAFDSDDDNPDGMPRRYAPDNGEAEDIILNNGYNETDLQIEQQSRDAGTWGKTRFGKGEFKTFYKAIRDDDGQRYLYVAFYRKGGFPTDKDVYLKLGQVNCGKVPDGGHAEVHAGEETTWLKICIDDDIPGNYGLANYFPLIKDKETGARHYLNPYLVKAQNQNGHLVPDDWAKKDNGFEFGTVNGVSVYCNTSYDINGNVLKYNEGLYMPDGIHLWKYQCVDLCARYTMNQYKEIKRTSKWGNAIEWITKRADDEEDPGRYIVFDNDGSEKVRQGDYIVWDCNHIAVVVNVKDNEISVAHQNGGDGSLAFPIGTRLAIDGNGVILDKHPDHNRSPIYKEGSDNKIINFIRVKGVGIGDYETPYDYDDYNLFMQVNKTKLDFGNDMEVGQSRTLEFTITTSSPREKSLKIGSVSLSNNEEFTTDLKTCSIGENSSQTFHVTFTPKRGGTYEEYLEFRSNANDNKSWRINLGAFVNGNANHLALSSSVVRLEMGEEATVKVEGGSGNYSVRTVNSGDAEVVSATVQGGNVTLKGLSPGKAAVHVEDAAAGLSDVIHVKVNEGDSKEQMLSTTVYGVTYNIYKEVLDRNDVHTNGDGHPFYRSALTIDITKNGKTTTRTLDENIYLDDAFDHHGGQRPCLLIDYKTKKLWVFINSKNDNRRYGMDGYAYGSPLDGTSFTREQVFGSANYGWFPYFVTNSSGQPAIAHFSYAGYYAMLSSRNSDGSWSTETCEYIRPEAFEQRSYAAGNVLLIR